MTKNSNPKAIALEAELRKVFTWVYVLPQPTEGEDIFEFHLMKEELAQREMELEDPIPDTIDWQEKYTDDETRDSWMFIGKLK